MMRATVSELPPGEKPIKILMLCEGKLASALWACAFKVSMASAFKNTVANRAHRRVFSIENGKLSSMVTVSLLLVSEV